MGYRLDAHIPGFVVNSCRFTVLLDIAGCFVDLIDKGRGRQDLGNQRVGIERDGSHHVIQLIRREQGITRLCRHARRIRQFDVVGPHHMPGDECQDKKYGLNIITFFSSASP